MRTSFLLISIAVHGAALGAALGVGVYAQVSRVQPPARIEIDSRAESAPPTTQAILLPEVVPEPPLVNGALPSVDVEPSVAEPEPAEQPFVDSEPLLQPSVVMQRATLERVRKVVPPATEVVPPAPVEPIVEPVVPPLASPQAYVEARERSDNEPPDYPARERRLQREGTVVVAVVIDEVGAVREVSLRKPSRYAGFNREALRAVSKWRFEPAKRHGVAVVSETDVEVVFRLSGG